MTDWFKQECDRRGLSVMQTLDQLARENDAYLAGWNESRSDVPPVADVTYTTREEGNVRKSVSLAKPAETHPHDGLNLAGLLDQACRLLGRASFFGFPSERFEGEVEAFLDVMQVRGFGIQPVPSATAETSPHVSREVEA